MNRTKYLLALALIAFLLGGAIKLLIDPKEFFEASPRDTIDRDVSMWMNYEMLPKLELRRQLHESCIVKWQYDQLVNRQSDKVGMIPDEVMSGCHKQAVAQSEWLEFEVWRERTDLSMLPPRQTSILPYTRRSQQTTGIPGV